MRVFKFFGDNRYNIQDDPLYFLDVYQNMALGLISYCYRTDRLPLGWKHHFHESGPQHGPRDGVYKCLVITELDRHNNFESPHVKIGYDIHIINVPGNANMTETTRHSFHLAEDVFNSVMRRYENL